MYSVTTGVPVLITRPIVRAKCTGSACMSPFPYKGTLLTFGEQMSVCTRALCAHVIRIIACKFMHVPVGPSYTGPVTLIDMALPHTAVRAELRR